MDIERPKNIQQGPPVTKLVTSRDSHNNSVNNTVICSSSLSNATFILHLDLELIILVYQIITGYALYALNLRIVRGLYPSLAPSAKIHSVRYFIRYTL